MSAGIHAEKPGSVAGWFAAKSCVNFRMDDERGLTAKIQLMRQFLALHTNNDDGRLDVLEPNGTVAVEGATALTRSAMAYPSGESSARTPLARQLRLLQETIDSE